MGGVQDLVNSIPCINSFDHCDSTFLLDGVFYFCNFSFCFVSMKIAFLIDDFK